MFRLLQWHFFCSQAEARYQHSTLEQYLQYDRMGEWPAWPRPAAAVGRAHDLLGEDDALPDATSIELAQHYWYVDSTKAEHELGWSSRDPMATLADTVADLRERGVVMLRAPR